MVSPAPSPSNAIDATSPGWMSGVMFKSVPAPQHTPPGSLTTNATSPSATTAWALPMTVPPRMILSVAVSPRWFWMPCTATASRPGKTTRLSGNSGTAAYAPAAPHAPAAMTAASAAAPHRIGKCGRATRGAGGVGMRHTLGNGREDGMNGPCLLDEARATAHPGRLDVG